jgi:hypothetical protein
MVQALQGMVKESEKESIASNSVFFWPAIALSVLLPLLRSRAERLSAILAAEARLRLAPHQIGAQLLRQPSLAVARPVRNLFTGRFHQCISRFGNRKRLLAWFARKEHGEGPGNGFEALAVAFHCQGGKEADQGGTGEADDSRMPIIDIGGKRLLFIHVPKTGGSAVEQHFARFGTVYFERTRDRALRARCIARHYHGAPLSDLFPAGTFDGAFMVVRHPVARVLSDFGYYVKRKGLERKPPRFSWWLRYRLWRARRNPYFMDNHFRPQHEFECHGARVFRYEDGLDTCLAELIDTFGLPIPPKLPKVNVSPKLDLRPTDAEIALIKETYRGDFERYGYE